jgi:hypothetical protein
MTSSPEATTISELANGGDKHSNDKHSNDDSRNGEHNGDRATENDDYVTLAVSSVAGDGRSASGAGRNDDTPIDTQATVDAAIGASAGANGAGTVRVGVDNHYGFDRLDQRYSRSYRSINRYCGAPTKGRWERPFVGPSRFAARR